MAPHPQLSRVAAHGTRFLRLPALHVAVQGAAVLAAALVAVALAAGEWLAAAVGGAALAAAGLASVCLRALGRELRQTQRTRAEWERRYYRLHDSVAVGLFRADPQGRLVGANRGLCTLLGYRSEAELVAADFGQQAYVGPGTFEAVLMRARAQGAFEDLEKRLRRFDGLTVTVLAAGGLVAAPDSSAVREDPDDAGASGAWFTVRVRGRSPEGVAGVADTGWTVVGGRDALSEYRSWRAESC